MSIRQRHGCSPDRGDCHSFHFSACCLWELKKKIHFFIKGLDKTKIMLTGADFVSKSSHAQRIKQLGSRLGSMAFPEFPKAERKREKAPKSCDFGSFSWRRRRDLRTELRRERGGSPSKPGCKQSNSAVNRSVPPDRIPNRPTPAKREPNSYGSGSLFGGEGEI